MKVSVIIPLYNQKEFVTEAIESVLNQTFKDIEIVIVNDGSTDNPYKILDKYKTKARIIYQENKGLAAARNKGIKESSGEYIQFLDADDFIFPDKISRQLSIFKQSDKFNIIPYCGCIRVFSKDLNSSKDFKYQTVENLDIDPIIKIIDTQNVFPIPIHTTLLKKKMIIDCGGFNENLYANEDRFFWTQLCLNGAKFIFDNTYGVKYRKHPSSMTHDKNRMIHSHLKYLETFQGLYLNVNDIPIDIRKKLTDLYFVFFYIALKQPGLMIDSNYLIKKIILHAPCDYFESKTRIKRFFLRTFGLKLYLFMLNLFKSI